MKKLSTLLIPLLIIALVFSFFGCDDEEDATQTPTPTVTVELTPTPTPEEAIYKDASGLFSVPIPTNWTVESSEDGYGTLSSPEGNLTFYVMAIEAGSVEEGVEAAWAVIDPSFDLEPVEVIQEPVTGGADEAVQISYDAGDEIVLAGGWLYEGIAYVEIIRSDVITLQKRISQISIINSGFNIYALEEEDLSGVEPLPLTEDLLDELEAYIVESMEYYEVPGVAVSIVKDGEIVYSEGFGVREMGGDESVTPETLMLIGSTTKTMTTMLMAKMVDEGFMDWDTPVVDILPTFAVADPEVSGKITVQNLVCACTGVPRKDMEMLFNSDELNAEDIIESIATFEGWGELGEAFQYSNQMVATGGYIATLAAGGEYGNLQDEYVTLMQENIFDPIGMQNTTFSFEDARESGNYGTPHGTTLMFEFKPIPIEVEESFLPPVAPAGGAWSNVLDMGRYLITVINEGVAPDGTEVVSPENLNKTWEPQVAISDEASYGLGWMIDEYKGLPMLHHGGNTFGFTSDLALLPEAGLGISVLTNQYGCFLNQLVRFRLLELLYQQDFEYDELGRFQLDLIKDSLAEFEEEIQEGIDNEEIVEHLGSFTNEALGEVTIQWEGESLLFDAGEFQAEIRSSINEDDEIYYFLYDSELAGLLIVFEKDIDENSILVVGSGVNEYTFDKVE